MFLVCGEAVIDMFESRTEALSFHGQPAGSPFNVAVGLARLGCETAFMTGLSRDVFGERLIIALQKEGVDWRLAPRTDRPTILSFVMVKPGGAPDYAFYGQAGADLDVSADSLPTALPEAIRAIHIGGFPMALEPAKTAYAVLIRRESKTRFIALDPNIRAKLMGEMDIFRDHFEGLCPSVALIKASVEDIAALYPGLDAMTIAKRWRSLGAGTIIITDGEKGAFGLNRQGLVLSKATPVPVIDTVGAGDSFMAALLASLASHELLQRERLAEASSATMKSLLDIANRAAGITCTRRGANPPTRSEMMMP